MAIFMGIELNLQISLDNMVILTVLILLIQEHTWQLSFFFVSLSNSYIFVFQFSEYRCLTSLVEFITRFFRCFILLCLADSSLLGQSNKDVYASLIPATLQNSFISSYTFFSLIETLGFSICSITSSANGDSFTSSLPFD